MPQDPNPLNDPEVRREVDLKQGIINRCQLIIDGLGTNEAWDMVLEDIKKERQRLDDTWHLVTEEKQWYEFRVTKMAVMKIINLLNDYKTDAVSAHKEIAELTNSGEQIIRDVDND